jgi:hypothetical protein
MPPSRDYRRRERRAAGRPVIRHVMFDADGVVWCLDLACLVLAR